MKQLIASSINAARGMNRRRFLKSSAIGCGIIGAGLFISRAATSSAASAQSEANIIGPREGFSPQIGTLVSMLEWMRRAILEPVQGLSMADLDYLHDSKANTIGALLLHLAATERHYQIHTFEGRKWNDWDEDTHKQWDVPAQLGAEARRTIKGKELSYYLNALAEGRERTLSAFHKRDDAWLMQIDQHWTWGPTNNYCKWFHVCEHESHHNGQVTWIKARLPGAKTNKTSLITRSPQRCTPLQLVSRLAPEALDRGYRGLRTEISSRQEPSLEVFCSTLHARPSFPL